MHRFIARVRERSRREQGFYMVWFAVTFVALTSFAGLALEFNRWQQIATRAQKAADAAALGGAVFLPDNVGNKAFTTAQTLASQNGYTNGSNGVTVTPSVGKLPNQLNVTISIVTHNPWGALVGYGSTTIVRHAVAEYQLPQNLGSPQNIYGNDPESAAAQPQFWGNVFGPSSSKSKGDAIQAAGPSPAAASLCDADNCASSVNKDYSANGYFYGIDVPAGTVGPLNVQVFDPAFVHVGDQCGSSDTNASNSLTAAATLTAGQIPGYTGSIPPSTRYAASGSSAFCTGDNYYSDGSNSASPWTLWTLRSPDNSPWDPSNNAIVCQNDFPGVYPETSNNTPTGTVNSTELKTLLQQSTTYPGTNPARTFASFFRQWVTLCTINNPTQGTYYLEVQTNKKSDGTTPTNAGGSNRFSIRVGNGSDYTTSNGIHVYGNQSMGIYANETGATTQFYLTRVLPGEAGKTLVLNFYDIGDAAQPGTLTIIPPPDSNVGSSFSGCTYTAPPGNSTGPPWGTFSNTNSGCSIAVTNSGFNGQWVTFEIPVPTTYTCTTSSATGCWVRLSVVFPQGSSVTDTTTWNAYILGEPVRIVQ